MTTRWAAVAAHLREEIEHGLLGTRGELDTEAELCRRFATSRITVRRALQELKSEGLVQSRRGSGWTATRSTGPTRRIHITGTPAASGATAPLTRSGLTWRTARPTSTLVDVVRRLTGTEPARAAPWVRMSYVMRVGGAPFDLVDVWFAPGIAGLVSRDGLARHPTARILDEHGVRFARPIQAARADVATTRDAAHLGTRLYDPILVVERLLPEVSGPVAFVSIHRHPGRHVTIGVDLPTSNTHPNDGIQVGLR